jgi:hypothetical protein
MGVSFPVLNMSALHDVQPQFKGAVTSLVVFFRTIGSALGVTVFGVIQSNSLHSQIPQQLAAQVGDGRALLQPEVQAHIPAQVLKQLLAAFSHSITLVFKWEMVLPVVALLVTLTLMGGARLIVPQSGPGQSGKDAGKERPAFQTE